MLLKAEKLNLHPLEMTLDDIKNEATTIRFGGGGEGGGGSGSSPGGPDFESASFGFAGPAASAPGTSSFSGQTAGFGEYGGGESASFEFAGPAASPPGTTSFSTERGMYGSSPVGHVSPGVQLSPSQQLEAEKMGKSLVGIASPMASANYGVPGYSGSYTAAQARELGAYKAGLPGHILGMLSGPIGLAKGVYGMSKAAQELADLGISIDRGTIGSPEPDLASGVTADPHGDYNPRSVVAPVGPPLLPRPATPEPLPAPAPAPVPAPVTPAPQIGPVTRVVVPTVTIPTPAQYREMSAAEVDERNELEARRRAAIAERRQREQEEALRTYSTAIRPPAFYEERTALERATATPKRRILSNPRNA